MRQFLFCSPCNPEWERGCGGINKTSPHQTRGILLKLKAKITTIQDQVWWCHHDISYRGGPHYSIFFTAYFDFFWIIDDCTIHIWKKISVKYWYCIMNFYRNGLKAFSIMHFQNVFLKLDRLYYGLTDWL